MTRDERRAMFYEGQRVLIRAWEDMADEFGVAPGGVIPCALSFTEGMRYLCGREYTILSITNNIVDLRDFYDGWNISVDMIEPVQDDDPRLYERPVDAEELNGFMQILCGQA